ncbi:MAG: peptidoglycan DD-metalloendopeptidase family protein [Pseudomonadota bacterium]
MLRRAVAAIAVLTFTLVACAERTPAPVSYGPSRAKPAADPRPVYYTSAAVAPAEAPLGYVKIAPGDTVYHLSRVYKVDVDTIIEANDLEPPYPLQVGQFIRIPSAPSHVVTPGETLYAISRQYGRDVASLAIANDMTPPYTLQVGQSLRIPAAGEVGAPASARTRAYAQATPSQGMPERKTRLSTITSKPTQPVERQSLPPVRVQKASYATPSVKPNPDSPFIWPVEGDVISRYGAKPGGRRNDGVNIAAAEGTPIRAAAAGEVVYRGSELDGYGNLLLIRHEGGWVTAYAHAKTILVRKGQKVRQGQLVARVGKTGSVDRPQLHFEVRRGLNALNPETLVAGR